MSMPSNPPAESPAAAAIRTDYAARLTARREAWQARDRAHLRLSQVRLALVGAGMLILVAGGLDAAWWLLVPAALFAIVAVVHAFALRARARAQAAVDFYDRGLARLDDRWIGTGDTGERYRPADHLYADDLDLFGRGSLFELLGTVRTHGGQETLAAWLLQPSPRDVVEARQAAIRELASRVDLRERMAVAGDGLPRAAVDAPALRVWASGPPLVASRWPRVAMAAASAFVAGTIVWSYSSGALPIWWGRIALAVFAAQAAWVIFMRARVEHTIRAVAMPARDLDLFSTLLRIVEDEAFTSERLQAIRAGLARSGRPASAEITRLGRLLALLESRNNIFTALPAALVFWGTQMALAIDRWRSRLRDDVPNWLALIGEFDALAALGGFAAEHPDYVFPAYTTGPAVHATAMAHPLLPRSAVANDLALGGAGPRLLVVSGSNMSGKSTFLRALGLNLVLAQTGAPVRATRFECSDLAVGASIRVVDSLTDGRSRFYAEITRLKAITTLAGAERDRVLFLLDEILSGTNSHDRRIGAEAVLANLVALGGIGMVTTHDLALASIAEAHGSQAANVHFEDQLAGESLHFDYRLRPGVVQTSNALALMRAIGLISGDGR